MRKIRIAQIGIGHGHASAAFGSLLRQNDLFEVKGWAPVAGEELRAEHPDEIYRSSPRLTVWEILKDSSLDAVTVETDYWNLTLYARLAAENGLHIHMDKTGSESQSDFDRLVGIIREKDLVFQTGYMYRYNPAIADAIRQARSGELGEIYSVEAHMDCLHTPEKRQWMCNLKGGMMYFLGCHLLDLILLTQGLPEEILPMNCSTGLDGVTGEDFGFALFRYPNGISFAKTCACEPGGFMRRQLVICGSKKTLELRPLEAYVDEGNSLLSTRTRTADSPDWNRDGDYSESSPRNRYDAMLADFAAMVRGEKENPFTPEYEAQLHRVVLSACGTPTDFQTVGDFVPKVFPEISL